MIRVYVQESFFADPDKERSHALSSNFSKVKHNSLDYPGIAEVADPGAVEQLQKIIGAEIDSSKIVYRRYLKNDHQSTWIHADSNLSDWTAVCFLTRKKDCNGGIGFWKHREYGWDFHPTTDEIKAAGKEDTKEFWDSLLKDGLEEKKWRMVEYVPMEFNRLVLFPSSAFHARIPKLQSTRELENARLIKTYFLKCKRKSS